MCLIKIRGHDLPADGAIRYKVLARHKESGKLYSGILFGYTKTEWELNQELVKQNSVPCVTSEEHENRYKIDRAGFHMLTSLKDAQEFIEHEKREPEYHIFHELVIAKCACSSLVAAGISNIDYNFRPEGEIWKSVTPLEIINE